jgi:RNA polymerase sigma-70 factor (ECF subfamily)
VWCGSTEKQAAKRVSDRYPDLEARSDAAAGRHDPTAGFTEETRRRLLRLAFRFLWRVEDAEDAVQEALQSAHAHRRQLQDPAKWWSWLCRIVVQKCQALGRDRGRERKLLRGAGESVSEPESLEPHLSVETAAVHRTIAALPRRQREVLVLRHLEGMGYDEIAVILNITPSTARVHARAALESMRDALRARHPDWFTERARIEDSHDDA